MRTKLFYVAGVLVLGMLRVGSSAELMEEHGTQWFPYLEWTFQNPSWQGSAFDVVAQATFVHEGSGTERTSTMFYQGATEWRLRFTGTMTGAWTFRTVSTDPDLNGHTGKLVIRPNPKQNAHGFLKAFGNKWGWQGTDEVFVPQLVMWDYIVGDNSPKHFFGQPHLVDAKIDEFMNGHGFNGFHVSVIGGRWFDMEAATDRVDRSMAEPDHRSFEALELLITSVHAARGMVHIWLWGDHQRSQTCRSLEGGRGGPIDLRLQRYIAARLGPIPGWSMGYGFDLDEWVQAKQLRQWHDHMHQHLGWSHFLGGRPKGPNRGLDHRADAAWNQGLDYASYEHHQPSYEVYVASLRASAGRPVMSEDRFRVREGRYPEKDYTEERTLRGLYHSTLAGGVANIWGVHPDLSPGGVFNKKVQLKTYATFFFSRGRFLADMEPANHLSPDKRSSVLLSPSARSVVLYQEDTNAIEIDLRGWSDAVSVIAVDAQAAYEEIDMGKRPAQRQALTLPTRSDWVLALGDFQASHPVLSFSDIWRGPALKGGHGAMWADIDDNGLPDLYLPLIISETLPDLLLVNRGAGTFVEQGRARGVADVDGGSHGATWCDLDNDGDYDLINGTTFDDGSGIQNDVFRNDGKGHFVEVRPHALESCQAPTRAFISFDMDRDGDLDLFGVSNYQGSADPPDERNEIYRNDGNFEFTAITSGDLYTAPAGQGATDTDYDGDGDIDILAANRTGPVNILKNDGKGNFTRIDPALISIRHTAPDGTSTGDIDNDGDLDLLLTGGDNPGHLYTNNGDGSFNYTRSFSETDGYMGGFADLDNDGDLDLYFAGDTKVYLNTGNGLFEPGPVVPMVNKNDPRGVAFADIDNDGDLDFAVGNKRSALNFIMRNDLSGGGHWLKVKLVTARGQAGAFGAKTTIYPAGQAGGAALAMRESQSNCGYLGQNDPVLHFGLGDRTCVDVLVRFLDGTTVTRGRVTADQTILIEGFRNRRSG